MIKIITGFVLGALTAAAAAAWGQSSLLDTTGGVSAATPQRSLRSPNDILYLKYDGLEAYPTASMIPVIRGTDGIAPLLAIDAEGRVKCQP